MKKQMQADEIMGSIDNALRAELSPFIKNKIIYNLYDSSNEKESFLNKYAFVFAISLLLMVFNLILYKNQLHKVNTIDNSNSVETFSAEYSLNNLPIVNF
jgi:hypothetical protein